MPSGPARQRVGGSNPLPRISVTSAPKAAAEALRSGIIRGDFKPGERLLEQKLAARLGIGQPTLREAFQELEYQGFVRKGPQRGTYVTKLSPNDFRDIQEVRLVLEVLAIDKAARHMTPQAQEELTALVQAMGDAAEAFDLGSFHKIDVAFHRQVWALAGNDYLANALELVAFRLFAFVLIQRSRHARNEFVAATQQHKEIVAGLATQDPAKAREVFLSSTLKFWNEHHRVGISEAALAYFPGASETKAPGDSKAVA